MFFKEKIKDGQKLLKPNSTLILNYYENIKINLIN